MAENSELIRPAAPSLDETAERWAVRQIEDALRGLQFGQVTITVQDGVVVQVERTERRRFQRAARKNWPFDSVNSVAFFRLPWCRGKTIITKTVNMVMYQATILSAARDLGR
jgi:hypothetical protein